MGSSPVRILSAPGIKRDGTALEGEPHIDGQWCRWARGLPRKIGGYRQVNSSMTEKIYGMRSDSVAGVQYIHAGSATKLTQVQVDSDGVLLTQNDRTPAAYAGSVNNLWQLEIMYDVTSAKGRLIAHATPSNQLIDSSTATVVYYGDVDGTGALTTTATPTESGGICVAGPTLLKFGSNGHIAWSVFNKPADFTNAGSGDAFITGQKIVRGLPLRGSGAGSAALLWSLDSLLRAQYVGGTALWAFDTLSASSSILSSLSPIEFDGVYYWAGVDRFLMFNGVQREVPNQFNTNWFFDNLCPGHHEKVFAFKIPRWGEIWWCYPRGTASECTHAVIYNVRENCWYDTALPGNGRSAGFFSQVYKKPFMVDVDLTSTGYSLWQHETGTDAVMGSQSNAVQSYFQTGEISMLTSAEPKDKSLHVGRIESDFLQRGPLNLTVFGRANARATELSSEVIPIPEIPTGPDEETTPLKEVRRLMSFKFESNVSGGDYEMGHVIAQIEPADGRVNS